MENNWKLETLAVQAGYIPGDGDARIAPIVQSTTYKYDNAQSVADLFDLKKAGFFYTRLANPTVDCFEKRIAALEGGVAAVALSSGQTANFSAIANIAKCGDHVVTIAALYETDHFVVFIRRQLGNSCELKNFTNLTACFDCVFSIFFSRNNDVVGIVELLFVTVPDAQLFTAGHRVSSDIFAVISEHILNFTYQSALYTCNVSENCSCFEEPLVCCNPLLENMGIKRKNQQVSFADHLAVRFCCTFCDDTVFKGVLDCSRVCVNCFNCVSGLGQASGVASAYDSQADHQNISLFSYLQFPLPQFQGCAVSQKSPENFWSLLSPPLLFHL